MSGYLPEEIRLIEWGKVNRRGVEGWRPASDRAGLIKLLESNPNGWPYRIYESEIFNIPGKINGAILWPYVYVRRAGKNRPWIEVGRLFASCRADAQDVAKEKFGVDTGRGADARTLSASEWVDVQTRQHLKQIGIKFR